MSEILAGDLEDKRIVGTDGTNFGRLHNITVEPESGALCDLVVERDDRSTKPSERVAEDRLRIPFERIETVKDQIVVQVNDR